MLLELYTMIIVHEIILIFRVDFSFVKINQNNVRKPLKIVLEGSIFLF